MNPAQPFAHAVTDRTDDDQAALRLVTRAKRGDEAALTELCLRYFDRVYAYIRVASDDVDDAEDLTRQVFAAALQGLPGYEPRREPWRAWLFGIAASMCVERSRERFDGEPEQAAPSATGPEPPRAESLRALGWTSDADLMLLVGRLPALQRQVIGLRYVLGFSGIAIAKLLDREADDVGRIHDGALHFLEDRLAALSREPVERRRPLSMQVRRRQAVLRPAHGFTLARFS